MADSPIKHTSSEQHRRLTRELLTTGSESAKKYVTCPHLTWFQQWRMTQEHPTEWQYVYRLEQIRYLSDQVLYVVSRGNTQLVGDPAFPSLCRHNRLTVEYLT